MSQFYLTLPSNASMNVYPNNTVAQYTTKLADTIELDGDWEVGLVEIIYTHTWESVRANECKITMREMSDGKVYKVCLGYLPAGYYESGKELTEEFTKFANVCEFTKAPTFKYDSVTNKISINVPEKMDVTFFGDELIEMSGFRRLKSEGESERAQYMTFTNRTVSYRKPEMYTSEFPVDVKRGFYSLYVYCDVLAHMHVGDTRAPLLRAVAVRGKYGQAVHEWFSKVTYVPLQKKVFDSIEINIMTDTGKPVPFVGGKSLVTLHFRRSSNPYLLSK